MNRKTRFRIILISAILMGAGLAAWGLQRTFSLKTAPVAVTKPKAVKSNSTAADPVLLKKYQAIYGKYDTLKNNCTMAGTFNIVDQADTAGSMNNVPFLFCKRGNDFYYRLGTTETINGNGTYIFIDHLAKTILISQQKKIVYDQEPAMFADLGAMVKSEGYELSASSTGTDQTISLHNEHNINCKLFTITYDTTTNDIKHLHARMTNIQEPLEKDKEKLVDIALNEWDGKADIAKHVNSKDLLNINGKWKAEGIYKNYEVKTLE